MKENAMRIVLISIVVGFCLFCGFLVAESGLFEGGSAVGQGCILLQQADSGQEQGGANEDAVEQPSLTVAAAAASFGADSAPAETIVLGAGSIDQAHQPDEYIEMKMLDPAVDIIRRLIAHYCF